MLNLESLPILDPPADPLPASLIDTVENIQLIVFCFTIPFYTFIVFFIVEAQARKIAGISTPFFKLCLSTAIIDFLTLFANYFGSRFPKWGWGRDIYLYLDGIYTHTYYYIAWTVGINQAMCAAVLSVNRLSAILFPLKYNTYWSTHNLRRSICIQLVPGILLSCLTFFNTTQLYRNQNNGIEPKFLNYTLTNAFFVTGGIYLLAICIFLVASYCYLFIVIRRQGRRSLTNHSHNDLSYKQAMATAKTREFKLFIMSSIIVLVELMLLSIFINDTFRFVQISNDTFQLLYNIICDLYSSINPYLLWIFSDTLRDYILKRVGIKKKKKVTSSVITLTSCL